MASPVFRQAFAVFNNAVPIDKAVSQTVIKIIHLDFQNNPYHTEQSWFKALEADGVKISYLQHPCELTSIEGDQQKTLAQVELRHTFTEKFWGFCEREPVAGAIAVSHLRALHEALSTTSAELIIVLEGDATETENTPQLFASFVANWFNNPQLQYTKCVSLSYSSWHGQYDKLIRENHKVIKGSRVPPYFQLIEMPWVANEKGHKSFRFVGQGARSLAYSREFAKSIIAKRVNHFYDMWIIEELTKERKDFEAKNKKYGEYNSIYLCCEPPVFEHVPTFDKRFRGSGRLASMATNTATEDSYYITIALTHKWGISNRINTIIVLSHICTLMRFGVYICWEPNVACPGTFGDIFTVDETAAIFKRLPFFQIFDDASNSNWKAAKNNKHWCKANFESQCSLEQGIDYFFVALNREATQRNDKYMVSELIPNYQEELAYDNLQMFLAVKDDILVDAKEYLADSKNYGDVMIGLHVRRGDYKWFNCNSMVEKLPGSKGQLLLDQWQEADNEFEDRTA